MLAHSQGFLSGLSYGLRWYEDVPVADWLSELWDTPGVKTLLHP